MQRHCSGCGLDKGPSEFYSSSSKCKECVKVAVQTNRLKNLAHYQEHDRARSMREDRVAARMEYSQTVDGKAARCRAARRWADANPRERAAQTALGNAVRHGKIFKWPVCAVPECSTTRVEGHHPDYDAPLAVIWLCARHHDDCHNVVTEILQNASADST